MKRSLSMLVVTTAMLLIAGCATQPESIVKTPLTARPQSTSAMVPPASGAIFQTSSYRPIFEDKRARLIGDTITIVINERSSAGKQAGSSASKTGTVSAAVPNIFGILPGVTRRLGASADNSVDYADKGVVTSSNNFVSTLSVTVIDVLPNGNLIVAGEKQVALDKSSEFIRFSGVVDPSTVAAGNIVSSQQVADAKIEYRSSNHVDTTEVMSMLARFFLSVMPL